MTESNSLTLLIDAQALQGADPERGIPRWLSEFASALKQRGVNCVGLTNPSLRTIHPQFVKCFQQVSENQRGIVRQLVDNRRTVYVVGSPLEPVRPVRALLPDHILDAGIPIATVMHDLALYRYPHFYQVHVGDEKTYAARRTLFRWTDKFLSISQSTARDVVELWKVPSDRVVVVGSGVSDFFQPDDNPISIPAARFVLTVGRRDPRKQTDFLIKMFAGLPANLKSHLKLVIVCRLDDEISDVWRSLALEVGLGDDQLVLTGLINDTDLRDLYRKCDVFVEPSLFEGFGLPLAEAAACGAVAICSRSSSLPEIIDTTENLFDPTDLKAATALLERALTDSALRARLKKASLLSPRAHRWDAVGARAHTLLDVMARKVNIPQVFASDYLDRGLPRGALGRTIPLACIDD